MGWELVVSAAIVAIPVVIGLIAWWGVKPITQIQDGIDEEH